MTRVRLPYPPETGRPFALPPDAAHHLGRILRLQTGARLTLFTGDGQEWSAQIMETAPRKITVQAEPGGIVDRESPLAITLIQAISKSRRMEYGIQKAVELGVRRIAPVFSQRSVVRLDARRQAQKTEHWQAVAVAACEQCGRNRIPEIDPAVKLQRYLETRPLEPSEQGLFLDPQGAHALSQLPRPGRIRILIGPEGGFTDQERACAAQCGYLDLRLGKRILRTETAGPAVIAALQTLWGDLG